MSFLIAHIGHTTKHDEHITWWNPHGSGYTVCTTKAGRYSEDKARAICQYGNSIAVPFQVAESLTRGTPYYRRHDGTLATLYDGDLHRSVENTTENWKRLLGQRLVCGQVVPYKPTPMSRNKARSIYLEPAPTSPAAPANPPDAGDEEQTAKESK